MRCRKVIARLSAFLDGELTVAEAEAVRSHLDACARCRSELEGLRRTVRAVAELPRERAPADLRRKVLSELEDAAVEPPRERVPRWRVYWGAAAAILIAGVILLLSAPEKRKSATRNNLMPVAQARQQFPRGGQDNQREIAQLRDARGAGEERLSLRSADSLKEGRAGGEKDRRKDLEFGRRLVADKETAERERGGSAGAPAVATGGVLDRTAAVSAVEEIAVPSADPRDAYSRALAIAGDRGWLPPEARKKASLDLVRADKPVPKMVLQLRRRQIPMLKDALAAAGLVPTAMLRLGDELPRKAETEAFHRNGHVAFAPKGPVSGDAKLLKEAEDLDRSAVPRLAQKKHWAADTDALRAAPTPAPAAEQFAFAAQPSAPGDMQTMSNTAPLFAGAIAAAARGEELVVVTLVFLPAELFAAPAAPGPAPARPAEVK